MVPLGAMGLCWSVIALSRLWGSFGLYPGSGDRRACAWRFACGFDFGGGLFLPFGAAFAVLGGLLMVPVGYGSLLAWDSLFGAVGGLRAVSKVENLA